jgi:autotransporter-associated beta strand protein
MRVERNQRKANRVMRKTKLVIFLSLTFTFILDARAGSATWNSSPGSNNWNTASNWTPATVPDGPGDTATFAVSNTSPFIRDFIEVNSLVFSSGASAFTIAVADITTGQSASLTLSGAGVVNNSGIVQAVSNLAGGFASGEIIFTGSATAGTQMTFLNVGGSNESGGGATEFFDDSNAGSADFVNEGGEIGGSVEFFDNSSAADATFTCEGAKFSGDFGSYIFFHDSSTAANATFVANGGMASNGGGAQVNFLSGSPTAGNATLIANGGTNGGDGGKIFFSDASTGDRTRVEVFGNGFLNIGSHDDPGIGIGSLEGDGLVDLGAKDLTVGKNNLDTTFTGVISGSGSLKKIGRGRLTLTGANTFTGGTTLGAGVLRVENKTGSATGTGSMNVNGGTLGGSGIISGAVTVGVGSGTGAFLAPSGESHQPATLTLQSALTFKADGIYTCRLNTRRATADQVLANGVTIESGTQFNFVAAANKRLRPGTVFTVISNTSANPVAGTFANLPDDSTFTVGNNTYQIDYQGGDGNDLTLTVVP